MLDAVTKRRIDDARDILVGKIPDPKSQVEQITIALIYKFMDDMDAESEELGGEAKFFSGEYQKYSWRSFFNKTRGGQEILLDYREALQKLSESPTLPQIFHTIFRLHDDLYFIYTGFQFVCPTDRDHRCLSIIWLCADCQRCHLISHFCLIFGNFRLKFRRKSSFGNRQGCQRIVF